VTKLIIQIPCFNEETALPATLADIPRVIPGVDSVEILVIDDGSTDRTAVVARGLGVDHVVRHRRNRGLAAAFQTGLQHALHLGADVIVNTDADNQYPGSDIPLLIQPILHGEADIVIGDRQTGQVAHFSWLKRRMQWLGSGVVRRLAGLEIPDAVSGFRAISREAALKINIMSSFSYTIEMLIQAGRRSMAVAHVPVAVNPQLRESRLFRSIPEFVAQSGTTALRAYAMYKPLRTFFYIGLCIFVIGLIPVGRFLYFYLVGDGAGHVQSLVLGGVALVLGFVTLLAGLLSDLISWNRRLLELSLECLRRLESRGGPREGPD
jgi:glycosyltransferase involved in cell wall biosynthesis